MTNGVDSVQKAWADLVEGFTESEVELPSEIYESLSKPIKLLDAELSKRMSEVSRINNISKLVSLLLSSPRISISDENLASLNTAISSGVFSENFRISLRIEEAEDEPIVDIEEEEERPTPIPRMAVSRTVFDVMSRSTRYAGRDLSRVLIVTEGGSNSVDAVISHINALRDDLTFDELFPRLPAQLEQRRAAYADRIWRTNPALEAFQINPEGI